MKLSKTAITAAVLAALITTPAMAGPKPIKGAYKCKGTVTKSVFIDSMDSGPREYKIKAKMLVFSTQGEFYIDVLTKGHQVSMLGAVPTQYAPNFEPQFSDSNSHLKGTAQGCMIKRLFMFGSGEQNKNGRKAFFSIRQFYWCLNSSNAYEDDYKLACKR